MLYITTREGVRVRVDDDVYQHLSLFTWQLNTTGYPVRKTTVSGKSRLVFLHRAVMGAVRGQQIDHRDGDILNCQRSNLRVSTQSQNRMNARKDRRGLSRYKGVRVQRSKPGFVVRITTPTERDAYIGTFEDEHLAALVYDLWAHDLYGEFARPNFPRVA